MKSYILNFFKIISIFLVINSCSVPNVENSAEDVTSNAPDEVVPNTISIPDGFNFSTHREVEITINDISDYVRYDIYAYSDDKYYVGDETFQNEFGETVTEQAYRNDILNKLVFTGVPVNGILKQKVNLPKYCNKLYVRRNQGLKFSSSIEKITDDELVYSYLNSESSGRNTRGNQVSDYLYCVNGSAELFQVDPLNGDLTFLSDMPMGSYTAAIDQENKTLYSIGRSSPYPLMKYYIETDTWETVANLGIGGPRLDFNVSDRLLYFSKQDKLYTFDPTDGTNLDIWKINGLHSTAGGDLAFAIDGTLFLCTFSGLYRLELNENNEYDSTRISADNLPFQPTSMTFDSNQELWLANNASSSDLIIMDTQTGGWQYQYGMNALNNTDFNRTINDLTTFRVYNDNPNTTDSDGDGILDIDDSYPEDPEAAFELFTPSKYGTGTIAFEDLWPSNGDYDFNDMALNYKAIAVLNSDNLAVRVDFICNVKSNFAGFTNGIGIEISGLSPSQIQNISGTIFTENYINLNSNGTEANQDRAVVILTDNADNLLSEKTISIKFNEPINTNELGAAPFNPFIIANKIREREIHLPYQNATLLGNNLIESSGANKDTDGNYISESGFPWAISIIHDFKVPKESIAINQAYNFFTDWASSGGNNHKDWYKDNPGNRNIDLIEN